MAKAVKQNETCLAKIGMTEAVKQNGNLPGKVGMAEGRRDSLEHMLGAAVKQKAHARAAVKQKSRSLETHSSKRRQNSLEQAARTLTITMTLASERPVLL